MLITQDENNYIKLLYNSQGIVFKFWGMHYNYTQHTAIIGEVVIATTESLINKKNIISFYHSVVLKKH